MILYENGTNGSLVLEAFNVDGENLSQGQLLRICPKKFGLCQMIETFAKKNESFRKSEVSAKNAEVA